MKFSPHFHIVPYTQIQWNQHMHVSVSLILKNIDFCFVFFESSLPTSISHYIKHLVFSSYFSIIRFFRSYFSVLDGSLATANFQHTKKTIENLSFFQFPCVVPFELKSKMDMCIQLRLTLQERYDGTNWHSPWWFHAFIH